MATVARTPAPALIKTRTAQPQQAHLDSRIPWYDLDRAELDILRAMLTRSTDGNWVRASVAYLAALSRTSRRTVQRVLHGRPLPPKRGRPKLGTYCKLGLLQQGLVSIIHHYSAELHIPPTYRIHEEVLQRFGVPIELQPYLPTPQRQNDRRPAPTSHQSSATVSQKALKNLEPEQVNQSREGRRRPPATEHSNGNGNGNSTRPRFTQKDFDERDWRLYTTERRAILKEWERSAAAAVGSGRVLTAANVCESAAYIAGLSVDRVHELIRRFEPQSCLIRANANPWEWARSLSDAELRYAIERNNAEHSPNEIEQIFSEAKRELSK